MMKHKIFLFSFLALAVVGLSTLADYIEPTGSAPNNNTGMPLKTGPDTPVSMYEKIGTCLGCSPESGVGNSFDLGLYTDKLSVMGTSQLGWTNSPSDLVVKNPTGSFDQYINTFNYIDPNTSVQYTSKPLEAIVNGRLTTRNLLIANQSNATATYNLELQPSSGFNPTTNIGLGDSCNLYPVDLSTGCLNDGNYNTSYVSMYKNPSWSGTLSNGNNTNTQVVAVCTKFLPSTSPTNTGHCTNNSFTNLVSVVKEIDGALCRWTAGNGTHNSISGFENGATFNGKNVTKKWYNGGTYDSTQDGKTVITYGCGSGPWKIVVQDDYGQYIDKTE